MILVDFSAIMHQMLFSSISIVKPKKDKETNKLITSDFIGLMKYKILEELFNIQTKFSGTYKEIVLCLDNHTAKNWRKNILGSYKINRHKERDQSDINFSEVYSEIDELLEQLDKNSPWKVIDVPSAEGDDCILVLARNYANSEPVLIVSFDKDMIQAQKFGDVKQYNQLTGHYVTAKDKNTNSIDEWLVEHVVLGDSTDDIPRIVDNLDFSEKFKRYLKENNYNINEFEFAKLTSNEKYNIIKNYNTHIIDKNGKSTLKLDIFNKHRFGPSNLKKMIKEYHSLDNWLDSNPLLRLNYEQNKKLILSEYIPDEIRRSIIEKYKASENKYNNDFRKYLESQNMGNILTILPTNFSDSEELTVEDLLW